MEAKRISDQWRAPAFGVPDGGRKPEVGYTNRRRNHKRGLLNFRLKHIVQKRRRDHQFIERTMKGGIVKVWKGLVPVAAHLLIGMRSQHSMKKMAGCDRDGKHHHQPYGNNFLYATLFLQGKAATGSVKNERLLQK